MGVKLTLTAAVFMFAAGFALLLQMGDWNRVKKMIFQNICLVDNCLILVCGMIFALNQRNRYRIGLRKLVATLFLGS